MIDLEAARIERHLLTVTAADWAASDSLRARWRGGFEHEARSSRQGGKAPAVHG